jgi:glycosyltransferase involved in cell wall biosynthesis
MHIVSSLLVGGMEQLVVRIAVEQQRQGHSVSVLSLKGGELEDGLRNARVPCCVLGGRSRTLRLLRAVRFFRSQRPAIINAHNPPAIRYADIGRRVCAPRIVVTCHGMGFGDYTEPTAFEWSITDAIIAVSRASASTSYIARHPQKLALIPNGVEIPRKVRSRIDVRRELGLGREVVAIIVARIDGRKGHETLLRALSRLGHREAPMTTLIVGDGAERAAIQEMAQGVGLGDRHVRFLGYRVDVPDLLAASDMFVLPSITEGMPLSVLEAMAQRLPVIATPVGGVPELVESGREGFLVPVSDVTALAERMGELLEDPALRERMGRAGLRRVEEHYSWAQMCSAYEQLYIRVLNGAFSAEQKVP